VIILGVNPMADASACLVKNGQLINYIERERFEPRWKHARKYIKSKDRVETLSVIECIKWCLQDARITIDKVDTIVISWYADPVKMASLYRVVPYVKEDREEWEKRCLEEHAPNTMKKNLVEELENAELTPVPEISFLGHHLSHASTAFASGWDKCAILTVDGHGDSTAIAGWMKDGPEIKPLFHKPFWNSLGWFYSGVTEFLGLKMKNDETKVMNLSNYARLSPTYYNKMKKIVQITDDDVNVDSSYLLYGTHKISKNPRFSDKFISLFGEPYHNLEKSYRTISDVRESIPAKIAHAAQRILEDALLVLCDKLYKMTGCDKLVISGGVALNCKANARILRESRFKDVFVIPPAHDGGTAIGAALYRVSHYGNKDPTFELEHAFYGPEYSRADIEHVLERYEMNFYETDPVSKAVELLMDNEILAWFQGRREMGPRALMNTSILADPRDLRNFYRVNKYDKKSVLWRDRSPSVTRSFASQHFDQYDSKLDKFMLGLRSVIGGKIPAVTSFRRETRPQIIDHPILTLLEEEIRCGAVMNTSFNQPGKSIVNDPKQAIEDAKAMGLRHLIIGDFYVDLGIY